MRWDKTYECSGCGGKVKLKVGYCNSLMFDKGTKGTKPAIFHMDLSVSKSEKLEDKMMASAFYGSCEMKYKEEHLAVTRDQEFAGSGMRVNPQRLRSLEKFAIIEELENNEKQVFRFIDAVQEAYRKKERERKKLFEFIEIIQEVYRRK